MIESHLRQIFTIFFEVHVPVREDEAMIDKILDTARSMATPDRLMSRKVLRLKIEINVGLSIDVDEDDDDYCCYYDADEDSALNSVPDQSLNLGPLPHCVVCLQQFMIGSSATRLPCTHVYHDRCIRDWLKTNGVCPLRRYRIV
ncbi:conserved hypothetical protein [Ricinus communis]|uniref:RING-type domain-containing protein n=1 Tax=Ricinus communis TaxID=3988 RepID=B9R973_RICCO|nr:conserved hypothetical protein [Ricinus communis]